MVSLACQVQHSALLSRAIGSSCSQSSGKAGSVSRMVGSVSFQSITQPLPMFSVGLPCFPSHDALYYNRHIITIHNFLLTDYIFNGFFSVYERFVSVYESQVCLVPIEYRRRDAGPLELHLPLQEQ